MCLSRQLVRDQTKVLGRARLFGFGLGFEPKFEKNLGPSSGPIFLSYTNLKVCLKEQEFNM